MYSYVWRFKKDLLISHFKHHLLETFWPQKEGLQGCCDWNEKYQSLRSVELCSGSVIYDPIIQSKHSGSLSYAYSEDVNSTESRSAYKTLYRSGTSSKQFIIQYIDRTKTLGLFTFSCCYQMPHDGVFNAYNGETSL